MHKQTNAETDTDIEKLAVGLCQAVRDRVLPHLGRAQARTHAGTAVGGDITFGIDEEAEEFLAGYLKESGAEVAIYSEDRGLIEFGRPEYVLIVDPIDGTRPAAAGLEGAMVSIACARYSKAPKMKDVTFAALQEIKSGTLFTAHRGAGVQIAAAGGAHVPVTLSPNTDLTKLFWTIGFRGRPSRILVEVLGDLIDMSSTGGAVFDLGSATFSMTRLLTGQLDAYIDLGPRIIDEAPQARRLFEQVGAGSVLNNSPHDLAAVALICAEGGAVIGDGYGGSLDERLLLGSDYTYQMSCVAASNSELYHSLMEEVDRGIKRLKESFGMPH